VLSPRRRNDICAAGILDTVGLVGTLVFAIPAALLGVSSSPSATVPSSAAFSLSSPS
jgi:hypothetical protein